MLAASAELDEAVKRRAAGRNLRIFCTCTMHTGVAVLRLLGQVAYDLQVMLSIWCDFVTLGECLLDTAL